MSPTPRATTPLRTVLAQRRMSLHALAVLARVHPNGVRRWAVGRTRRHILPAYRVARVLDVPVGTLWPNYEETRLAA